MKCSISPAMCCCPDWPNRMSTWTKRSPPAGRISYLTSVLNSTPHCAALSRTQLRQAHEDDLIAILDRGDYGQLGPADAALARYVHKVTVAPGSVSEDDIEALRAAGFSGVDILDANNRTAHLNYTNRVANGLGLLSEPVEEERSLTRVPGYEEADDDTE